MIKKLMKKLLKKLLKHSEAVAISLVIVILASAPILNTYKTLDLETKKHHAELVFVELQKYTDSGMIFPKLVVVDDDKPNAWTDGTTVTITKGMLKFLQTDDEIATILGHEIGHVMLGHILNWGDPVISPTINESNADRYGIYLTMRAGYDPCAAEAVWQRMIETYGHETESLDGVHPPLDMRKASMEFPICHIF